MARKTKTTQRNASRGAARKSGTSGRKAVPARRPVAAAPTAKKQLLDSYARESQLTLKVLRAYPPGQADFRPHMRSKSARELAYTFVIEQSLLLRALKDELALGSGGPPPVPTELQTIIDQFEQGVHEVVERVKHMPEPRLYTTIQFPTGPGEMGTWTKLAFAWFLLSDQIHHRGQYSVYLRLAGGKVPAIYGPSADEPWR